MVERIELRVKVGAERLEGAAPRYALLRRVRECADRQGVVLLAFGLGRRTLRLVLDGHPADVTEVVRGVKVGTAASVRPTGLLLWSDNEVLGPVALDEAVAWAHAAPLRAGASGPLATPWSSHRDLLGVRHADFFDAEPARRRVDPARVHDLLGGGPLPGRPRPVDRSESTQLLLRVAGAVRGLLPSDRRCFRLFVHLARATGRSTVDVAAALRLGERRVRQLFAEPEPLLRPALVSLSDGRLRVVP